MDINQIQKDLWEWERTHFPMAIGHPEQFVLGMAEEVGEVAHMVLKSIQKIREGKEGLTEEVKLQIVDGVYDTLVFGLQLLSELGVEFEPGFSELIYKEILKRDWNEFRK